MKNPWRLTSSGNLGRKEEQALKNIGDPATLLGVYSEEEEEQEVSKAIEQGISADDFSKQLDQNVQEDDFMDFLLSEATSEETENAPETQDDETLLRIRNTSIRQ